jgi:hypothetical protein
VVVVLKFNGLYPVLAAAPVAMEAFVDGVVQYLSDVSDLDSSAVIIDSIVSGSVIVSARLLYPAGATAATMSTACAAVGQSVPPALTSAAGALTTSSCTPPVAATAATTPRGARRGRGRAHHGSARSPRAAGLSSSPLLPL